MTSLVGNHGIYAVFGLMLVGAVIPIGSELVLLYAGAVAGGAFSGITLHLFGASLHSHMSAFLAVAVAAVLGNLVGAAAGWWIGERGGRALLHRYGRYVHVSDARLARAERWFDRFDDWAVPLGFVTPLIRSFVAIPAGIFVMPFRKFLALGAVGIVVFCFGLAAAGWALGSAYVHAHHALKYVDYVIAAGVVLVAAYLIYRWLKAARVRRRADTAR